MCKILDEMRPETAPHKAYIGFRYAYPRASDALAEVLISNQRHRCAPTVGQISMSPNTHHGPHARTCLCTAQAPEWLVCADESRRGAACDRVLAVPSVVVHHRWFIDERSMASGKHSV
jgi:hypothetical protein